MIHAARSAFLPTVTLLLAMAFRTDAAEPNCELRVGWEPYAPYTFSDSSGQATGADVDLIRTIGEEIGCAVVFAELPWPRILREIEIGTLDVSTSTSRTAERTSWAWFSQPYRQAEVAVYVRAEDLETLALENLADIDQENFRLGVIADYYYGDEIEKILNNERYEEIIDGATDYQTNIRKLINGRIDGFLVDDANVMEAELTRLQARDQVKRLQLRLAGEELRFMFSRKTVAHDTVGLIDEVIDRMRSDGRLQQIMDRYLE